MTNLKRQYTVCCNISCRLDVFLAYCQSSQSRNTWQKLIRSGSISVNNKIITETRQIINYSDIISILKFPEPKKTKLNPIKYDLDIVFEDKDIIVINKPPNMIVHPATADFDSKPCLVNYLLNYSPNNLSHLSTNRPGIIHRLDKDTSGLLLIAKNNESHNLMVKELEARRISRLYLALVFGSINLPQRLVNSASRDPKHRIKMSIHPNGRLMVTDIFPIISNGQNGGKARALLAVRIHTGRTHQIRLQLSYLGFPIIGDRVYGNHTRTSAERQCLHAYTLSFIHPKSQKKVNFYSKLPKDFTDSCFSQNIDISSPNILKLVDLALLKLMSLETPSISIAVSSNSIKQIS